jgi:hypothetical protein
MEAVDEKDDGGADAFDFFTPEPIGSAARDLERQKELQAVAEAPPVAPIPAPVQEVAVPIVEGKEVTTEIVRSIEVKDVSMEAGNEEEDDVKEDAFDFFTPEPIGSAARDLERQEEIEAAAADTEKIQVQVTTVVCQASESVPAVPIEETPIPETEISTKDLHGAAAAVVEEEEEEKDTWVTETSESVATFYTETVKKVTINEAGEEIIEELKRVIGPDGKEVPQEMFEKLGYKMD